MMAVRDHPTLPDNVTLSYLAEGAANIVYRIHIPPGTPQPSVLEEYGDDEPQPTEIDSAPIWLRQFENKLLRLRKDLPTTSPCAAGHDTWLRLIAPLFPADQIVHQSLVELRPPGIITKLNEELRSWEQSSERSTIKKSHLRSLDLRPTQRQGIYLAEDDHGLLVTDMTSSGESGEEIIEFKPKWLCQSPSAPANSKRCRQCARAARTNARRARTGEHLMPLLCPLDLVSKSPSDLELVSSRLLAPDKDPAIIRRFARWLETNTLLQQLRTYQEMLDQKGVLVGDVDDENFLVAMTLRDCTVFVRFPPEGSGREIEARLGDLDVKSSRKKDYWRSIELPLIEEGWYAGTENKEDRQPLICRLSPERWNKRREEKDS
ncbi:hypothetical protein M430DRAFT_59443 [Amorphotheca resinae ATCC 22711]|uniref:Inositol-pentakisphosphate 2-kinase n=1 Tax=Amorphotheca resinae ATCC 22711 TaxID=857342 RepID=A0A2T3B0Y7_AMORE|nr:hypothetical protein M430DRAFT_59443 [Amorphotheca resinae ATCC 22711]PSS17066.1 hypothetical protein M430DRAFT_59443 [Amorphotheca resinae ATCC 22711]